MLQNLPNSKQHENWELGSWLAGWLLLHAILFLLWHPYGTLRTGDIEDSDVEDTTLIKISMESEGSQTNGSAIDWYKNLTSLEKCLKRKSRLNL